MSFWSKVTNPLLKGRLFDFLGVSGLGVDDLFTDLSYNPVKFEVPPIIHVSERVLDKDPLPPPKILTVPPLT